MSKIQLVKAVRVFIMKGVNFKYSLKSEQISQFRLDREALQQETSELIKTNLENFDDINFLGYFLG
jgi:hypothetical protein